MAKGQSKKSIASIIGTVFTCVISAFAVFLLVTVLWTVIDKRVNHSPIPSAWGHSFLSVTSGSMHGEFDKGDIVIIKKVDPNTLKPGDVITFIHSGETTPTTHRIESVNGDTFTTKGDFNNSADTEPVTKDEVLGIMVGKIKYGGLVTEWITQKHGWAYLVAIIVVATLLVTLLKMMRKNKQQEE